TSSASACARPRNRRARKTARPNRTRLHRGMPMETCAPKAKVLGPAAAYLGAVALCLACLTWLTQLWKVDLSFPFDYTRDALFTQLLVSTVHETGWYLH